MLATEKAGARPGHHATALLAEADRLMTVCNSCRYCEGLCAVFPAMEMRRAFPDSTMPKLPNSHRLYRSFFRFPDGPPQTSHELNGWGDDIVHDYLRAVEHRGRVGVLYSNKDYGCEWDYDWRNKRFQRQDNTKFAVNIVVYAMT